MDAPAKTRPLGEPSRQPRRTQRRAVAAKISEADSLERSYGLYLAASWNPPRGGSAPYARRLPKIGFVQRRV